LPIKTGPIFTVRVGFLSIFIRTKDIRFGGYTQKNYDFYLNYDKMDSLYVRGSSGKDLLYLPE
jgi:hypothetical protein